MILPQLLEMKTYRVEEAASHEHEAELSRAGGKHEQD